MFHNRHRESETLCFLSNLQFKPLMCFVPELQLAREWMRKHIEGESERMFEEGGVLPARADPQRLIDALVSITSADSRSSHLGSGLQQLLSQIASPQKELPQKPQQQTQPPSAGAAAPPLDVVMATHDDQNGDDANVMPAPPSHRSQRSSAGRRLSEFNPAASQVVDNSGGHAAGGGGGGLSNPQGRLLPPGVQLLGKLVLCCSVLFA